MYIYIYIYIYTHAYTSLAGAREQAMGGHRLPQHRRDQLQGPAGNAEQEQASHIRHPGQLFAPVLPATNFLSVPYIYIYIYICIHVIYTYI